MAARGDFPSKIYLIRGSEESNDGRLSGTSSSSYFISFYSVCSFSSVSISVVEFNYSSSSVTVYYISEAVGIGWEEQEELSAGNSNIPG